jgi:hypothetical protein
MVANFLSQSGHNLNPSGAHLSHLDTIQKRVYGMMLFVSYPVAKTIVSYYGMGSVLAALFVGFLSGMLLCFTLEAWTLVPLSVQ